jgi:hypothetical protein
MAIVAAIALAPVSAQVSPRRAVSAGALLAFPGFFHGQPVVVRGSLATRDHAVLLSPSIDRAIPLIFTTRTGSDGPVELRATFWDVGRFERTDPRIQALGLDRLVPSDPEAEWPRPGAVCALVVTDAMPVKAAEGAPSLRVVALEAASYAGQRVRIKGQFRGRNLYADLPQGPGLSRYDFVLRAADAAVWVTGQRPRGKGFNLDVSARVDTGTWLEASGVVREKHGLVWVEAQQLTLSRPDLEPRQIDTAPAKLVGPPPEVIFSDPTSAELDVPLKTVVRLQFSRDMDAGTFKGRIRWSYAGTGPAGAEPASSPQRQEPPHQYDRAKRSLEIRLEPGGSAMYRDVVIELLDGIAATDGAPLQPWTLTFAYGGR